MGGGASGGEERSVRNIGDVSITEDTIWSSTSSSMLAAMGDDRRS